MPQRERLAGYLSAPEESLVSLRIDQQAQHQVDNLGAIGFLKNSNGGGRAHDLRNGRIHSGKRHFSNPSFLRFWRKLLRCTPGMGPYFSMASLCFSVP